MDGWPYCAHKRGENIGEGHLVTASEARDVHVTDGRGGCPFPPGRPSWGHGDIAQVNCSTKMTTLGLLMWLYFKHGGKRGPLVALWINRIIGSARPGVPSTFMPVYKLHVQMENKWTKSRETIEWYPSNEGTKPSKARFRRLSDHVQPGNSRSVTDPFTTSSVSYACLYLWRILSVLVNIQQFIYDFLSCIIFM